MNSWKLKQIFEKEKKEKQKIKRVAMTVRERERRENGVNQIPNRELQQSQKWRRMATEGRRERGQTYL